MATGNGKVQFYLYLLNYALYHEAVFLQGCDVLRPDVSNLGNEQ